MADGQNVYSESAAIQHAVERLRPLAQGLRLDEVTTRQIVEAVRVENPFGTEAERLVEARYRMIVASA
jgi:hypothetical protein